MPKISGTKALNECVIGRRYPSNKYQAEDVLRGDSKKASIDGSNCIADKHTEKIKIPNILNVYWKKGSFNVLIRNKPYKKENTNI